MKKTKQKQPKRIKADIHTGLDDQTVRTRKLEGYDNSFKDKNTKSIPRILFDNFFNSFNIVLLSIAAAFLFFAIYLNSHGYKDIADRYFGFSKFTFLQTLASKPTPPTLAIKLSRLREVLSSLRLRQNTS